MKSKTKYYVDDIAIAKVFEKADLGSVVSVAVLNAGEYNTAYCVQTDSGEYVLKIAPQSSAKVLTYEQNLMEQEVSFYRLIEGKAPVLTPIIYCVDQSREILPSPYFIMQKLNSTPMSQCKLTKVDKDNAYRGVGSMVASLHNIKGTKHGYVQNGLHDNWYAAIKSMVNNLIDDCKSCGKKAKYGLQLLEYIEKFKDVLIGVEPIYTHFDIWDGNVFYEKCEGYIKLTLIDTERSFWGDGLGDFVSIEMFKELDKKLAVKEYNKFAVAPINFSKEQIVRYNIMRAYLGLIVYTEKFVRYGKCQLKYIINVVLGKMLCGKGLRALKKL